MPISGSELGYKVDVASKLQASVVLTLENGVALFVRESELLQVFSFICLESFPVLVLHERHAEHVDPISLSRSFGVKDKSTGNVVIVMSLSHKLFSSSPRNSWSATSQSLHNRFAAHYNSSQRFNEFCSAV